MEEQAQGILAPPNAPEALADMGFCGGDRRGQGILYLPLAQVIAQIPWADVRRIAGQPLLAERLRMRGEESSRYPIGVPRVDPKPE